MPLVNVLTVVSTGLSLAAATVTFTVIGVAENSVPSDATTVNAPIVPFTSADGVHASVSPVANVVVPGVTGVPPLVSVPLMTDSIRYEIVAPASTSAASVAKLANVMLFAASSVADPIVVTLVIVGASLTAAMSTSMLLAAVEAATPSQP